MKVTLNTVLETFTEYAQINHIPLNENRAYKWAAFLPEDPEEMSADVLYMVDLNDLENELILDKGFSYLCIVSNDNGERRSIPNGCLFIKGIESLQALAQITQRRFAQLCDWESRLKEIVISDGGYQELIDASEYILGNPLQVLDASYKLLATTNNIISDDEIDKKLIESGFHSQDTLRKIQESGRLKAYKEETGIIINRPGNPNKYGTVSRWFWDSGMPVVHTVMICKSGSPSPALIDLFRVLTDHCHMCFKRGQSQNPKTGRIYDSLINDILFGELSDESQIDERAKVADIPVKGYFTIFKIILKENNEWLIKRVFSELFQHLPNARIVIHQFEIIVLNCYDVNTVQNQMKKDVERLWPLLQNFGALCGISAPFSRIIEMPKAFGQAAKALAIGEKLDNSKVFPNDDVNALFSVNPRENVYRFDDIAVYYMISLGIQNSSNAFDNTVCWKTVEKLWKDDQVDDNDNAQILFTYLVTERKATKTGEILHMHRNNVIYRINKIEEMTGFILDDYWTRERILHSFHLLRLKVANGTE